jgi:hypothetical protein
MLVDIHKANVSLLRNEVLRRDPSIDHRLLTRRNCVAWLSANGVNEIPTLEYERELSGLFEVSFDVGPTSRDYTFTEHFEEIEGNSHDPMVMIPHADTSYINYSGVHDISYDSLLIQSNLTTRSLVLRNENIIDLLTDVMSDIRTMNQTLSLMRSNIESFRIETENVQADVSISTGNVFSFEIVQGNVTFSDANCVYSMQSSIVNIHMHALLSNTDNQGFSVRLPFPVQGKPFMSMRLSTNTGLTSTVAKIHTHDSQVIVDSHLFRESSEFPIQFQLDGTYVSEYEPTITWITPMQFDERRDIYINPNDVTVSSDMIRFEKGAMQWNLIDQSTKLNTNMTFKVSAGILPPDLHITIRLPDSNEMLDTTTLNVSGYGSVLLLPDSRFTVRSPFVYVDTQTRTLHVRVHILNRTNVDSVVISTHTIYYSSNVQ